MESCHECIFIINKLNQEFLDLFNDYEKLEKENKLLKKYYKKDDKDPKNDVIIYKDFNYHRVSLS